MCGIVTSSYKIYGYDLTDIKSILKGCNLLMKYRRDKR